MEISIQKVKILNVRKLNVKGRVMDVNVRKNHTFITSNGLVTSNCDFLLKNSQASLRPIMERYSLTSRFVFTGNYAERIIPAIKSRCSCFDFSADNLEDKKTMLADFFKRCALILKEKNIPYNRKILSNFIINMFPDWRRCINELQSYATGFGEINEGIISLSTKDEVAKELYGHLTNKKFLDLKKWVAETVVSADDVFTALYEGMDECVPDIAKHVNIIPILAKYQFWSSSVANQKLNLLACLVELVNEVFNKPV